VKRVIHALQVGKDEVRASKPKTVELIIRLLKMDKEAAAETYDAFQTTLNPTGIPNRSGIDNLVRSLQAQGRFTDRKVAFNDVADVTKFRINAIAVGLIAHVILRSPATKNLLFAFWQR